MGRKEFYTVFSLLKLHIKPLDATVSTESEASIHYYQKWTEKDTDS